MKIKILTSAVRALSLLLLVSATCALAQERRPVHFSGVINDYSPMSSITGSPYEMHGQWSIDLHESGTADFLADMTMSGYGTTNGVLDATKGGQGAQPGEWHEQEGRRRRKRSEFSARLDPRQLPADLLLEP